MKLWHGIVFGLVAINGAHAQAATIVSYCNSQYPDNAQGLVAPINARNCSAYITNNLSTVPYQGQVSTVYPLVAMGANISGTVSATYLKGNGSQITGIGTASPTWGSISGIPSQVAQVSNSGSISLTNLDVSTLLRGTAVSVTGNMSVTTINGIVPSFGAAPSWYTITNIPTYVQSVSNSGNIAVTNLQASANVTATNIIASGALIGGPTSVTTLLATGLITGQSSMTLTGTLSGPSLISTSNGGLISTTFLNAKNVSASTLTVASCTGCPSLSAWVKFSGATAQTNSSTSINAQVNVANVSGTTTGVYNVKFSSPLSNANYAITSNAYLVGGNGIIMSICGNNPTSSTFTICAADRLGSAVDPSPVTIMIQD